MSDGGAVDDGTIARDEAAGERGPAMPKLSVNPGRPSASGSWRANPVCGKVYQNSVSWSSRRV
ncbi:hypothetical protein [Streptomyces sp. NPDC002520]